MSPYDLIDIQPIVNYLYKFKCEIQYIFRNLRDYWKYFKIY